MTISIDEGQWRAIPAGECNGEDIFIGRLDSSLGVMVYDTQSLVTFAGHFAGTFAGTFAPHGAAPGPQHAAPLCLMLDQALAEFRASPLVRIYVSGCAEQEDESWGNKGSEKHRFVESELRKRHRPNQRKDIRWPRSTVFYSQMSLYPADGEYCCSFHW
jgi:hypothetical protein